MTTASPGTLLPVGRIQIAVIGPGSCTAREYESTPAGGRLIAREGLVLLCSGLRGAMGAACRGALEESGLTIWILPDTGQGNPYLSMVIRPGLCPARNAVLVQSADVVPAFGGSYGTLLEMVLALKCGSSVLGNYT